MKDYVDLLHQVDSWYEGVRKAHPDKVTCTKGCRDCCLGLYDISIADRELLREGLAKADPDTRRDIESRAARIMADLREQFPKLKDTLDGLAPHEIDEVCDAAGPVECPVLGREGECRLYAHRPLVCRLAGV